MASITTWMRLEPHSRAVDMQASLEMRIHDPLWLLARQWQFGEFQGEDTGSPVSVSVNGEKMPLNLFLRGPIMGHKKNDVQEYSAGEPIEYLVEREYTSAEDIMRANRRLAVEAGQHFLRLLGEILANKYRTHLLDKFKMQAVAKEEQTEADASSLVFLKWMANRAIDGSLLLMAIQTSDRANPAFSLDFDPNDVQAANQAISLWKDWCQEIIGPLEEKEVPRPSWNPERMEYACTLATPGLSKGEQVILEAKEYVGGHLDWYSFDATRTTDPNQKLKRDISIPTTKHKSSTIPTNLTFRGLPANRLWEFEDAEVRFASIQAAPTDLARMLLVEFLIAYGNDFFKIPIELEPGLLFHIDELKVTNTFGDEVFPLPFADPSWRLFALSAGSPDSDTELLSSILFLPPVLEQSLESPPLEEVHLLRDEMANIAWAVEKTVESKRGKPLSRHEAFQARRQRQEGDKSPVGEGTLVYRLDTSLSTLPDYWIPLVLEDGKAGEESPLKLACVDRQDNIRGRLLSELKEGSNSLFDQEVPRTGVQIKRAHQYTRWYESAMFSWIGREKRPGRGEGSSGLRNDIVEIVKTP